MITSTNLWSMGSGVSNSKGTDGNVRGLRTSTAKLPLLSP